MANGKVDLTLLKKMIAELETSLNLAEKIKADTTIDKNESVIEFSKAAGLAAGIMTEAGLLVGDIQGRSLGLPASGNKADIFLDKIFPSNKGSGNTN